MKAGWTQPHIYRWWQVRVYLRVGVYCCPGDISVVASLLHYEGIGSDIGKDERREDGVPSPGPANIKWGTGIEVRLKMAANLLLLTPLNLYQT